MDRTGADQFASEDAAISGLREQILCKRAQFTQLTLPSYARSYTTQLRLTLHWVANARHLFPETVKNYRALHDTDGTAKASDAFNIITFSDRSVVYYHNNLPVNHAVKAVLTYGVIGDASAKTALVTLPEWSRLRALRALLVLTEVLIESNARDLMKPEQATLGVVLGEGGSSKGDIDMRLLESNIEYARGVEAQGAFRG